MMAMTAWEGVTPARGRRAQDTPLTPLWPTRSFEVRGPESQRMQGKAPPNIPCPPGDRSPEGTAGFTDPGRLTHEGAPPAGGDRCHATGLSQITGLIHLPPNRLPPLNLHPHLPKGEARTPCALGSDCPSLHVSAARL